MVKWFCVEMGDICEYWDAWNGQDRVLGWDELEGRILEELLWTRFSGCIAYDTSRLV
jgi:hypothetical protein